MESIIVRQDQLTYKLIIMSQQIVEPQDFNIKNLWSHEPTRTYIVNQIVESGLKVLRMTAHHLYLSFQINQDQQMEHQTKFIVSVPKGFPIKPPQVYAQNSFITPSIKSYRDYLKPILKQKWHYSFHLKIIKPKTQQFLKQLFLNKVDRKYFSELGQYHKNIYYEYAILKQLSQHGPYIAFETNEQQVRFFVMSVTSTHFILFKPSIQPFFVENKLIAPRQNQISAMKIDFLAQIECLTALYHNRKSKHQFTFQFRGKSFENKNQYHSCRKTFKISKSAEMIGSLLKQIKHSKVSVDLISLKPQKNSEEQELLSETRLLQQKLRHFFDKPTVRALHGAYQKLVQYYSSVGLPYQQLYLKKMMNLQRRQDVNILMSNPSPKKRNQ